MGIWLWWPRMPFGIGAGGGRPFWYDLHVTSGIVAVVFLGVAVKAKVDALELTLYADHRLEQERPIAGDDRVRIVVEVVAVAMVPLVDDLP